MTDKQKFGADIIVDSLNNHDVDFVLGVPGAKIDRLFDKLENPEPGVKVPKMIITRHEQNAAFIAQGMARITGKPGVVIATSGPGVGNLATGLMTATAEGDPVIAFGGQVPRKDLYRLTHQSTKSVPLFEPLTKYSVEVQDENNLSEIISNAFVAAQDGKQGASFISIPQDVDDAPMADDAHALPATAAPRMGSAASEDVTWLAAQIKQAKLPVILVGQRGSDAATVHALQTLLHQTMLPVVETFQGAGVISRELEMDTFFGRIGLFRNQVGDRLLKQSDLVITLGYDAIEYEPRNWNAENELRIIAIDTAAAQIDNNFAPERQLIGNLAETLRNLQAAVAGYALSMDTIKILTKFKKELNQSDEPDFEAAPGLNHPLNIIKALQAHVTDDMTVANDIGSHYIWMARHFRSYKPRHFLLSNGMQTLGVGLPWAMAAALVRPESKAVAVAGDGGFFFSGVELATAVELKLNVVTLVWNDSAYYDMVKFQEEKKYGRHAGVKISDIDIVKFAESMGAKGLRVESADQLNAVLDEAFATDGPVVVDIPVDYSHNIDLASQLVESEG
ncbi:MAG: acetolactate synthase AlsS [Lactobacillaceae bacterium]|jgi:acetolactate synthase-1/2/3 large subunit|nr:acetolactate synthase AlsS [Lactobacillaceae bacterium]